MIPPLCSLDDETELVVRCGCWWVERRRGEEIEGVELARFECHFHFTFTSPLDFTAVQVTMAVTWLANPTSYEVHYEIRA